MTAKRVRGSIILALVSLISAACAQKPTKTHDNPERRMVPVPEAASLKLQTKTVVLDVRTPFEFSTGHIPKANNLQWSEFSERQAAQRGVLQADSFAIARRLARFGVDLSSNVVVVGNGFSGAGEEGRVAWMLAYLGVTDLRFANLAAFKGHLTTEHDDIDRSAPIWKPVINDGLLVTRAEMLAAVNQHAGTTPMSFRKGQKPQIYRLIDVREEKDYLGREGFGASHHIPNIDAVNIPWRQFFDPLLRPKYELITQLKAVGIDPSERVIVVGVDGVSSAAVTMALRAMGYASAGNYSGGYQDLMSAYGSGAGSNSGSGNDARGAAPALKTPRSDAPSPTTSPGESVD